ncbi:MAG: hypothetical protein ALAOOOJD_03289 [bacterium]|nr:hypothetical protein [bacterium]
MSGHQDGFAFVAQRFQQMNEFKSGFGIEAGGRLVEQNCRRVFENGDGDAAFLAHAFGEAFQSLVVRLFLQTDAQEHTAIILFGVLGFAAEPREEIEILYRGKVGIEHHVLGDESDFLFGVQRFFMRHDTVDARFALGRLDEIEKQIDRRGFARAVGAEHGVNLLRLHRKRNVIECQHAVFVALG